MAKLSKNQSSLFRELSIVDGAIFAFHRQKWMLRPDLLFLRDLSEVKIDKPVFILGVVGGGSTILSRFLRRSPEVVTISGDADYWSGADQMATVMKSVLPWQYTDRQVSLPVDASDDSWFSEWAYASNNLLPYYRMSADDYEPDSAERFKRLIRVCIKLNGRRNGGRRFLDKSQIFSVKIGLLRKVLSESKPRFVSVVRNPYAICLKGATDTHLKFLRTSNQHRLEIACEHWTNTYRLAMDESAASDDTTLLRLEDVLSEPERQIEELCSFLELPFSNDLLPQESQTVPRGTRYSRRWYPLMKDVNKKWLSRLDSNSISTIQRICGDLASTLGYSPPTI